MLALQKTELHEKSTVLDAMIKALRTNQLCLEQSIAKGLEWQSLLESLSNMVHGMEARLRVVNVSNAIEAKTLLSQVQ